MLKQTLKHGTLIFFLSFTFIRHSQKNETRNNHKFIEAFFASYSMMLGIKKTILGAIKFN